MNFKVVFKENNNSFNANFKQVQQITDGGYDKGFNEGYDKGYQTGYGESYDKGFDKGFVDGKQAEYDMFWDIFQQRGSRAGYGGVFGYGWNDDNFNPKYDIVPTYCAQIFQNSIVTKFASKLKAKGLKFDVSKCNSFLQMFQGSNVKDVPELDGTINTSLSYTFGSNANVETIEKLILTEKLTNVSNAFGGAKYLTHCIFDGVLAITGLTMKDCKLLDKESIVSLVNILSTETNGLAITLSKTSVDVAFGGNNLYQVIPNIDVRGSTETTTKYISKTTSGVVCGMAQIEGGKDYVIRRNVSGKPWRYFFYDTEPLDTGAISIGGAYPSSLLGEVTIAAPQNAKYLVIKGGESLTEEEMEKFELVVCEEGSNSTEWQTLVATKTNWTINLS